MRSTCPSCASEHVAPTPNLKVTGGSSLTCASCGKIYPMELICPWCSCESVTLCPSQTGAGEDFLTCKNCGYVGPIGGNTIASPIHIAASSPSADTSSAYQNYLIAETPNGNYIGQYDIENIKLLLKNSTIKYTYFATPATGSYKDVIKRGGAKWIPVFSLLDEQGDAVVPRQTEHTPSQTEKDISAAGFGCFVICIVFVLATTFLCNYLYNIYYPPIHEHFFPSYENRLHEYAIVLASEYTTNEIAADNKYKGHLVEVTGQINLIGKDNDGQPYLRLSGVASCGVQCFLSKKAAELAATMVRGQTIILTGKEDGLMRNADGRTMNVILRNCDFEIEPPR